MAVFKLWEVREKSPPCLKKSPPPLISKPAAFLKKAVVFFSKPAGFFSVNIKVWMMRDYKVDKARFSDDFRHSVYEIVAQIPPGKVATYGEIAVLLGMPGCSRLVGKALKEVPPLLSLPCHRVVNAAGRLVPGWAEQEDLLLAEGVRLKANGCVDLKRFRMKT